jgi:hypothetical protein
MNIIKHMPQECDVQTVIYGTMLTARNKPTWFIDTELLITTVQFIAMFFKLYWYLRVIVSCDAMPGSLRDHYRYSGRTWPESWAWRKGYDQRDRGYGTKPLSSKPIWVRPLYYSVLTIPVAILRAGSILHPYKDITSFHTQITSVLKMAAAGYSEMLITIYKTVHGITSQKIVIIMVLAVRTSNLTCLYFIWFCYQCNQWQSHNYKALWSKYHYCNHVTYIQKCWLPITQKELYIFKQIHSIVISCKVTRKHKSSRAFQIKKSVKMKTALFWGVAHLAGTGSSSIYTLFRSCLFFYPEDGGCRFLQSAGTMIYRLHGGSSRNIVIFKFTITRNSISKMYNYFQTFLPQCDLKFHVLVRLGRSRCIWFNTHTLVKEHGNCLCHHYLLCSSICHFVFSDQPEQIV